MRLFHQLHQFPHTWSQVTQANWQKYPNPMSPQVIHVDVLNRQVDPDTGILRTERLITCKQPIPRLLERIFNTDSISYFHEISEVDPKKKTHCAISKNITFSNMVSLEEKVTYTEVDSSKTTFQQEAIVNVTGGIAGLRSYVEDFCVNRFQNNAERGLKGLEEVIRNLLASEQDFPH